MTLYTLSISKTHDDIEKQNTFHDIDQRDASYLAVGPDAVQNIDLAWPRLLSSWTNKNEFLERWYSHSHFTLGLSIHPCPHIIHARFICTHD